MKGKLDLGTIKTLQNRLASYAAMLNFAMILYLFIIQNTWFPWYMWIILGVVSMVVLLFIDIKVILPQQFSFEFSKSPPMMKLLENQKRIMNELGIEYEDN